MFLIKYREKLLAKFCIFKISISSTVIYKQCRLLFQSRWHCLLFSCSDFSRLINLSAFLCFLIYLSLLATSTTYAANGHVKKIAKTASITILLNHPNNLANCLARLEESSVVELNNFLKAIIQSESDKHDTSCIDGIKVDFNQNEYSKFHCLYSLLSLRYYQGISFTDFMKFMLFNKPVQMITRPLMKAMLKLCDIYKDMEGMTIGNMMAEVEAQKHADENINAFLKYKANDMTSHKKALYPENYVCTKCSANNSSWTSWFSRSKQQLGRYTKCILKKVANIASKAMYKAPFIGLIISPVGANSNKTYYCDSKDPIRGGLRCDGQTNCYDKSDEKASDCCKDGEKVIYDSAMACENSNKYDKTYKKFVVCKNNIVTRIDWLGDAINDCGDGSDEHASYCCKDGIKGINNSTSLCTKKYNTNEEFFVCKDDMSVIKKSDRCDGFKDCGDNSDESINGTNPTCFECRTNNSMIIVSDLRCNYVNDCPDSSDEVLHCPTNTYTNVYVAGAASTALLLSFVTYVAILAKYINIEGGTRAWLLSPFTEPVRFLLCKCNYNHPSKTNNNDETDNNEESENMQPMIKSASDSDANVHALNR